MPLQNALRHPGIAAALGAALLFGAGTPLAKWLLDAISPWLLAGLLYLGSGLGLTLYRVLKRAPAVRLAQGDALWVAGARLAGGIVGPVLLMLGLTAMPASGAALLLNAEGVFTALLAWFAFRENFDRRIAQDHGRQRQQGEHTATHECRRRAEAVPQQSGQCAGRAPLVTIS